jgi:hypothetical protein
LWLRYYCTHRLPPFVLPNTMAGQRLCFPACSPLQSGGRRVIGVCLPYVGGGYVAQPPHQKNDAGACGPTPQLVHRLWGWLRLLCYPLGDRSSDINAGTDAAP